MAVLRRALSLSRRSLRLGEHGNGLWVSLRARSRDRFVEARRSEAGLGPVTTSGSERAVRTGDDTILQSEHRYN